MLVKQRPDERFYLGGRIGLLQKTPAGHEPTGHIVGKRASRGVEHWQIGPQPNRLIGNFITAERQGIEPDIDNKRIDWLCCRQVQKRSGKIARGQRVVTHVFEHPLKALENESIVFHDKNDGHQFGISREFRIAIAVPCAARLKTMPECKPAPKWNVPEVNQRAQFLSKPELITSFLSPSRAGKLPLAKAVRGLFEAQIALMPE